LKPDMETASDADWLIASKRAGALEALLAASTPAAVAAVARDLKLGPAMVYRLLALYSRDPSTGATYRIAEDVEERSFGSGCGHSTGRTTERAARWNSLVLEAGTSARSVRAKNGSHCGSYRAP
jgi:hypothetical protein